MIYPRCLTAFDILVFFTNLSLTEFWVKYLVLFCLFWDTGVEQNVACWFHAGKTKLVLFDWSNSTGAIDVKTYGSVFEEKSFFKMLGLPFSSKLVWGFYIISIAKTASKKIGTLFRSMKFLSPEAALYLFKSTIWSSME